MPIYRIKYKKRRILSTYVVQSNTMWGLPFFWHTLYNASHISEAIRVRDMIRGH